MYIMWCYYLFDVVYYAGTASLEPVEAPEKLQEEEKMELSDLTKISQER